MFHILKMDCFPASYSLSVCLHVSAMGEHLSKCNSVRISLNNLILWSMKCMNSYVRVIHNVKALVMLNGVAPSTSSDKELGLCPSRS